jgi:SAM-dependent methyltransferase
VELAKRGHDVTVTDLAVGNVQLAKEKAREAGIEFTNVLAADARDLSAFQSDSFDVGLSLGPMYHLLEEGDRMLANAELNRVLKPGGLAFVAFITKTSVIRDNMLFCPERLLERKEHYESFLETGIVRQPPESGFVDFFAVHPDQVNVIMKSAHLENLEIVGCEGAMAFLQEKVRDMKASAMESVLDFNYRFVRDTSLLNASNHLMYIGRKPGQS